MHSLAHSVAHTRFSRTGLVRGAAACAAALLLSACSGNGTSAPAPQVQQAPASTEAPAVDPEARLRELGIELPEVAPPVANYVKAVRVGNLLFLSGHGPCGQLTP